MKTFFKFSILLVSALVAATGYVKADIALEGHPDQHSVANGRYFRDPRPDGSVEYKAFRSDATFTAQLIRYNLATGRWELYLTRRTGAPELAAWSDVTSSVSVLASGWRTAHGSGPVYVTWPLKVYNAIEQYATCNNCTWSNPRTWHSGIVPRTYDNVVIDGNVWLDIPSKCNNFVIRTGTTSSPVRSLVGRAAESRLKLYGNLFKGNGTLLQITELEFAGNTMQSVETNDRSYFFMLVSRVRINNPANINLRSEFGFVNFTSTRSEMTFVKGRIFLGSHDLTCETIIDADETRFIVTNGTGMLRFSARRAGESMLHRFPVGPSEDRYTPILVVFGTANRDYSTMRAKAAYNPGFFLPGDHVNIVYTVDHGTTLPPAGTPLPWVYQLQWDAADATSSFNRDYPVLVNKWNGAIWFATIGRGSVTGSGPFRLLFSAKSTGVNNFGIVTETKRIVGERMSAENIESNAEEAEMNFSTFPNPATSAGFNVNVADPAAAQLRLQNLSGMSIPFKTQKNSDHSLAIQPGQDLAPGMYLLQVRENDKTRVHKVLVK